MDQRVNSIIAKMEQSFAETLSLVTLSRTVNLSTARLWQLFKKETGAFTLFSEQLVWHPVLQYGGTLDWLGILGGAIGVIDYKTGSMQEWTKYQVVGYQKCIEPEDLLRVIPEDHFRLLPMKRWGLELKDNGRYNLQPYTNPNDSRLFQAMVALAWEKLNTKHTTWRDLDYGKRSDDNRSDRSAGIQSGWEQSHRASEDGGPGDLRHTNAPAGSGHDVGGQAPN